MAASSAAFLSSRKWLARPWTGSLVHWRFTPRRILSDALCDARREFAMTNPHRPTVTLRSACYNHAAFVEQSLDSVARQDFTDVQWIIADDASTDDSVAKIRRWLARHQASLERKGFSIKLLFHELNRGFVATLNEIVSLARSTYLCGLATDDVMLPDRISTGVRALEQDGGCYAVSYSNVYTIDATGRRASRRRIVRRAMPTGNIYEQLLHKCFVPAPSLMVRLDALRDVGEYDPNAAWEDYDMFLRLTERHEFVFCPQPLVEYRLHERNFHKTVNNGSEQLYWIFRKHIHHNAGRRRFLQHFADMIVCGEVNQRIDEDFRSLQLPHPPLFREGLRQFCRQPRKVYRGLLQRTRSEQTRAA